MDLSDLQFELPPGRIAQHPADPRDSAKLWVEVLGEGVGEATEVRCLADFLTAQDLLIFNDTRVLPARVWATRSSGARVELLFLEPSASPGLWVAMVRPAKKPKAGEWLQVSAMVRVRMVQRVLDSGGNPGATWIVRLEDREATSKTVEDLLEETGEMPLPPYIQRRPGGDPLDMDRYQTIFATTPGAVAAPTAGLHFTPELLGRFDEKGIPHARVTLHVGLGTFLPIQADSLDEHVMHEERFEVSDEVVEAVLACKQRGGRVIAVGTTSARALEAASTNGRLQGGAGRTDLFIRPGYSFRVIDGLFTNFHLPGSTLLLLVGALVGHSRLMEIYKMAIHAGWRFFSYGDAMLIMPKQSGGGSQTELPA